MKIAITLLLFTLLSTNSAFASGCGGGYWELIEESTLPDTKILMNYYGQYDSIVSLQGDYAYLKLANLGTRETKLTFHTSGLLLKSDDFVNLLTTIDQLYPRFTAKVKETKYMNEYYDDCYDIEEGTTKIRTEYSFEVKLQSGKLQKFKARTTSYEGPN